MNKNDSLFMPPFWSGIPEGLPAKAGILECLLFNCITTGYSIICKEYKLMLYMFTSIN